MIDYLIVEDEPMVAKRLERFVKEALGDEAGNGVHVRSKEEAAPLAAKLPASAIMFLDLNLFGADGFDLLEMDTQTAAKTIVVSADQSRAVEAFSHGVVDFVAKPFSQERIGQAIDRALKGRDPLAEPVKYIGGAPPRPGSSVVFAPLDDIIALHGADDYVEIELKDGRRLLTKKSMRDLERINPDFMRIHRSHIVNRKFVAEFVAQSGSRYRLQLTTGAALPIGRSRVEDVKGWLGV